MSYINAFKGFIEVLRNQGVDSYVCIERSRVAMDFWFSCSFVMGWPKIRSLFCKMAVVVLSCH